MALQATSPAIGAGGSVTTVAQSASPAVTAIVVANAAAVARTPGHYFIVIDGEELDVTAVNVSTNTLAVTRGVNGATPGTLAIGDAVYLFSDKRGFPRGSPPDIGSYQIVRSTTPGAPDLVDAFDSGVSNADDLTNLDNSTPAKALQFVVGGTVAGATVTLYQGATAIGSAVATGPGTTVTTNGTFDIAEGSARSPHAGPNRSSRSPRTRPDWS